jgi:hypothetical protein
MTSKNLIAFFVAEPYTKVDGCSGAELTFIDLSILHTTPFYAMIYVMMEDG